MCKYLSSAKKFIPAGDESKPSPHQAKGSFGIASGRECQNIKQFKFSVRIGQ